VDQAILLTYTSQEQFEALEKAGLLRASDVMTTTSDDEGLNDLAEATGLKKSELKVLSRVLQSALNIRMVARFRWQSSLDTAKMEEAAAIQLLQPSSPVPGATGLPREQEEIMFEGEE
jgi:hypothetical protein